MPGAAELGERRSTQRRGVARPLDVPEPLHNQLEVRRLDPGRAAVRAVRAETAWAELDAADPYPVEHGGDELVLDRHGIALELFPAVEWLHDRGPTGVAVEAIEAEDVPEQVGDGALESIEGRERVLAK